MYLCCRQRLPPKNVYYYRCPDHRRNYVMSFAFCFDREDDVYQFAYCYPYTYTRLQHYLASLERRNLPYLKREQLGLSVVSPNERRHKQVDKMKMHGFMQGSNSQLHDGDTSIFD
ncbi:Cytosolic carboxypeptidase 6 [Xenoophorus captivus]|uniref:Cytosolic carboxypeptidase 6 n=1 Tax=Xenoophorus captivus TaxID=1517983 RepID=A0ABV0Q6H0_9TELE